MKIEIQNKDKFILIIIVVALLLSTALTAAFLCSGYEKGQRDRARVVLNLSADNIENTFAEASHMAEMTGVHLAGTFSPEEFAALVAPFFNNELTAPFFSGEEVLYAYLIQDSTVVSALPAEEIGSEVGQVLSEYPYCFSISKLLKTPMVSGPLDYKDHSGCFFAAYPMYNADDVNTGQVILVLDGEGILEKLNLDYLRQEGYDYEFWQVDIEDGHKNVVQAYHQNTMLDDDERITMHFPNEAVLLIQPSDDWVPLSVKIPIILLSLVFYALVFICIHCVWSVRKNRRSLAQAARYREYGSYCNEAAFFDNLNKEIAQGKTVYSLFLFVMDDYASVYRKLEPQQREDYEEHIKNTFQTHIYNDHIIGKVRDNNYIVAIFDSLSVEDASDVAANLSLELLWKTEVDGVREHVHADWNFLRCPQDGTDPEAMLNRIMRNLEQNIKPQSN